MAADRQEIERLLGRPVASAERATWGFTNRTDLVTLRDGSRLVFQRFRRRSAAHHRLRVTEALVAPARAAGVPVAEVLAVGIEAEPAWLAYERLPGVPLPEAMDLEDPAFPPLARAMGELLERLRGLSRRSAAETGGSGPAVPALPWGDPDVLVDAAATWAARVEGLHGGVVRTLLDQVPSLFAGRAAVFAHGDFAPVNVLVEDGRITGLLDFEAARLADPLFDPAWWAWSVSFSGSNALATAWPALLSGAGIDPTEAGLAERVQVLQVLRMLELLASDQALDRGVREVVADRLRATLQEAGRA